MPEHDVERGRSRQLSSPAGSSESSESLISEERLSLLPPNIERENPSYKSTETVTTVEEPYQEESEALGEARRTKSVITIISLLLVGKSFPNLSE